MTQNETKHQKTKRIFKILGIIFTIAGLALAITGFASIFIAMNNEEMPSLFWCCFVGFPVLAVGLWMLMLGFRKEFMQYAKNETVPVFNDAAQQAQPGISAIADAVREKSDSVVCPNCGNPCPQDAKFCEKCGSALYKSCPDCGEQVSLDAQFCKKCGKKL